VSRKRRTPESTTDASLPSDREGEVRIIGGMFRGRRLKYHGDPVVRPMKHRTREAIFNLISTDCAGRHAIDLFAGTGALGLEALSRGAVGATFIEKHVPSARVVQQNIRTLGVEDRATVMITSAFLWGKRDLVAANERTSNQSSWLIFCSPPYAFFHERQSDMLELIRRLQAHAPPTSILVVEADDAFDFGILLDSDCGIEPAAWDLRAYSPAVVGIWRS
jgi:16S rRNA (guanine966-N2)-methyltransferase